MVEKVWIAILIWFAKGVADKSRDERRQERKKCAQGPETSQGAAAGFSPEKNERSIF